MAQHTHKEFAALCHITQAALSTYTKRKKVKVNDKGFYSDTDPLNAAFMAKWKEKAASNPAPTAKPAKKAAVLPKNQPKKVVETADEPEDADATITPAGPLTIRSNQTIIDKMHKLRDIELKEGKIRLQEIEENRKRGESLPYTGVQSLIVRFSENLKTGYRHGIESLITSVQQRKQLTAEDVTYITAEMNQVINRQLKNAIEATKKDMRNLQKEFSKVPATDRPAGTSATTPETETE